MMMRICCRKQQKRQNGIVSVVVVLLFVVVWIGNGFVEGAFGGSNIHSRYFLKTPLPPNSNDATTTTGTTMGGAQEKPKLILIGGCPGTGKSTFGMSVALDQGILKCISTDTVRAVMRSFVDEGVSPALHRSSYAEAFPGDDDPVRSWKDTCNVLASSVETLIDDAMARGTSIVVEGVHIIPSTKLIDKWIAHGGIAMGCILQIANEQRHKQQLRRRGFLTGVTEAEETKIANFHRIRAIQKEMMTLAQQSNWLQIEQRTSPDPLDLISYQMYGIEPTTMMFPDDNNNDNNNDFNNNYYYDDQQQQQNKQDDESPLPPPPPQQQQQPEKQKQEEILQQEITTTATMTTPNNLTQQQQPQQEHFNHHPVEIQPQKQKPVVVFQQQEQKQQQQQQQQEKQEKEQQQEEEQYQPPQPPPPPPSMEEDTTIVQPNAPKQQDNESVLPPKNQTTEATTQ